MVISLSSNRLLEKIFLKHWGYIKKNFKYNRTLLFSNIRYNHLLLLHGQQPSKTQYFCFHASVLLQITFCPALRGLNIFTWFLSHPPLWFWLDDQNECDGTTRHISHHRGAYKLNMLPQMHYAAGCWLWICDTVMQKCDCLMEERIRGKEAN